MVMDLRFKEDSNNLSNDIVQPGNYLPTCGEASYFHIQGNPKIFCNYTEEGGGGGSSEMLRSAGNKDCLCFVSHKTCISVASGDKISCLFPVLYSTKLDISLSLMWNGCCSLQCEIVHLKLSRNYQNESNLKTVISSLDHKPVSRGHCRGRKRLEQIRRSMDVNLIP